MINIKMLELKLLKKPSDIFNDAEIIVKVKEPQKVEVDMIKENQIVYTYLTFSCCKRINRGINKIKKY